MKREGNRIKQAVVKTGVSRCDGEVKERRTEWEIKVKG